MLADVDAGPAHRTFSPRTRLSLAVAQLCLIGVLAWVLATGQSDSTATQVDWGFIGFILVATIALAASGRVGWTSEKRFSPSDPRVIRYVSTIAQWGTLTYAVLAVLSAPIVIVSEIIFGPMG